MQDHHGERGLTGAFALVTGAGGDIGRATAVALAARGATVGLVGRTEGALEATAAEAGGSTHVLPTDLASEDALQVLVADVRRLFSDRLDVLVHCAGLYGRGPLEAASMEDFDVMHSTNVRAPYRLTQQLLPLLRPHRGQVVFACSSQSLAASGGLGQYAATQHARKAVADSLREETNADGMRVLTLIIGRTAGRTQEGLFAAEGREYRPEMLLQPAAIADTVTHCLTLPGTAEITTLTIRPAIKSY